MSAGGGFRGIFPSVNLLAANCRNSSAVNSLLGVYNRSGLIPSRTAEGADVTLCPEAPAVCAAEALLAPDWEVPVAALGIAETGSGAVLEEFAAAELPGRGAVLEEFAAAELPGSRAVLEEFAVEELPGSRAVLEEFAAAELPEPESPEVPQPPVAPGALSDEGAADGAEELPEPTGLGTLGEDVTPSVGGLEAAAELPTAAAFPGGTLGLALKEKLAAPLLLLTGKPAIMKWIRTVRMGTPVILQRCCTSILLNKT